jgi:hypothetical protein
MAQERVDLRFAATEGGEGFNRGPLAAAREDFAAQARAGFRVEHAFFFKGRIGIGRQYFRPLVAVITRCIAASEDMAEALREAVVERAAG